MERLLASLQGAITSVQSHFIIRSWPTDNKTIGEEAEKERKIITLQ